MLNSNNVRKRVFEDEGNEDGEDVEKSILSVEKEEEGNNTRIKNLL